MSKIHEGLRFCGGHDLRDLPPVSLYRVQRIKQKALLEEFISIECMTVALSRIV